MGTEYDYDFDWGVSEGYNNFDNAICLCAGFAGYKVARRCLNGVYEEEGGLVRSGINLICGMIGIKIAEEVRKKSRQIRIEIKKKRGAQNG